MFNFNELEEVTKNSNKPGVYIFTNIVNQKFYIGSSKNIRHRTVSHFSDLRNNKHGNSYLQNSYNKNGNTFKAYVYSYCSNYKEIEQKLLDEHCGNKDVCYNTSTTVKGNSISEEGRRILSEKSKKFWKENPEHYKKMLNSEGYKQRRLDFLEQVKDPEFQRNRIEKVVITNQKFYDIWLYNTKTQEKKFIGWNLSNFNKKYGLQSHNIYRIISGKGKITKDWMLLSNFENPPPKKERQLSESGRKVLSDKMKKMHKERPDIFEKFCAARDSKENIEKRSVKAKEQRKDPKYVENLLKHVSEAKQKFWDVTLIDPEYNKYYIGWNLSKFCDKFLLDKKNIQNMIKGHRVRSVKGWKVDPENSLSENNKS